ncbi:MAG: helix-turn-helix domain-containing protein [Puia sp.]|nr:helix-turn-helix domain-containing protein [Puia sp.]
MKEITIDERLRKLESDMAYIRGMVDNIHETIVLALKDHADERILSIKEASVFLGVLDEDTLYKMCRKGEVPFFKMGKLIKFKKTSLVKWKLEQPKDKIGSVDDHVQRYLLKNQLKG